jgi:hypothetical protein
MGLARMPAERLGCSAWALEAKRYDTGMSFSCYSLRILGPDIARQLAPCALRFDLRGVLFVSHLIGFLEQLGQDADLRRASDKMMEEALRSAGIDPALRAAILAGDRRVLEELMGAQPNICCTVHREDEEEEEEPEEEEEEEGDDEDEDEKALSGTQAR